jgi:anti-anti-sigma regulatory factor
LIGLHKRILKAGGLLKMANLHPSIKEAFHRNRLDALFVIHDSVGEAHEAFDGPVPPIAIDGDDRP